MSASPEEAEIGSATAKKSALSRTAVDAKFTSRGVSPSMIREATGVQKLDVSKMRVLLEIFEVAHEKNWDVAKGPWAHAVQFYKTFFNETLPESEPAAREWLIKDFVKKCWVILCSRLPGISQVEPTPAVEATTAVDAVANELVSSSSGFVEADEEKAYALAMAQRDERRSKELAAIDTDSAKAEVARVEMQAKLKWDRISRERLEAERISDENFAIEKKRRLDHLGEVERDNLLLSGKLGQGGGDRDSDVKAVREREVLRDSRPSFCDLAKKKSVVESDRSDRDREFSFNREQRDGRPRDSYFGLDGRKSSRELHADDHDRVVKPREFNLKGDDSRRDDRLRDTYFGFTESDGGGKWRDSNLKGDDSRRVSHDIEDDRRDRSSRVNDDDRRDRSGREDERRAPRVSEDDRRDRSFRDHEDDRRDRYLREEDRFGDERKGRLARETRDPLGDRLLRGREDVRGVAGYISRSDDVRETAGGFSRGQPVSAAASLASSAVLMRSVTALTRGSIESQNYLKP